MKRLLVPLFFVMYFLTLSDALAQQEPAHVLFINQVRGSECCAKGSFENLKTQIEVFIKNNIPAFFTLRYDVLNDREYIIYLKEIAQKRPDIIKLGLFIEITPQLSKDAQVGYEGSEHKWFEGQNAFTIGYTHEERKKIIDLLFLNFFQVFNYYPKFTTAWMIDTDSLNYIHTNYKVLVHQITREQWGIDSYTLYGGPPHYPYPASKNWVFLPDYANTDPILIVRQAVSDPLFNYGDTTNTFTSQANDYLQDKNTDYFISLIDQAVNQPSQTGFALLGLENSMDKKYQDEYLKQISYVNELWLKKQVKFPSLEELSSFWSIQKITVYYGKDFFNKMNSEAYWVTTPSYRVRLRIKNNELLITDLRLFDIGYSDPYNNQSAKKEGFWIVPYLIDGSHWYKPLVDQRPLLQKLFSPPMPSNIFWETQQDLKTKTVHIAFSELDNKQKIKVIRENNAIKFIYKTLSAQETEILFSPDKIIITPATQKKVLYEDYALQKLPLKLSKLSDGFKIEWRVGDQIAHALQNKCNDNQCVITFFKNASLLEKIRSEQYPFIFPEPVERELNEDSVILYAHNQYAVANRNPVRIIVMTKDIYDLPTISSQPLSVYTYPQIDKINNTQDLIEKPVQYIDLYHSTPQKFTVNVEVNQNIKKTVYVFFAPNCKQEIIYCLRHPQQTWWYLNVVVRDKIRKIILGEQQ